MGRASRAKEGRTSKVDVATIQVRINTFEMRARLAVVHAIVRASALLPRRWRDAIAHWAWNGGVQWVGRAIRVEAAR